jgi:S1-C subfamily serine protease
MIKSPESRLRIVPPRPSRRGSIALFLALVATGVGAQVRSIQPGETIRGEVQINSDPDSASFVTFSFEAGTDLVAFDIRLDSAADLDLYLDTEYINDYQDVLLSATGYSGSERLRADLSRDPELAGDQYFIDVTYGRVEPPVDARGNVSRRVPFSLSVTAHRLRIDDELEPGRIIEDRLDPRRYGPYRSFTIDVPRDADTLRIDLASDATDLDLRVRHENPMRSNREADFTAVSWAGYETIILRKDSGTLEPGRYYIDVFDQAWLDWQAAFRLVASLSEAPPEDLIELPEFVSAPGLAGAISSTVEILHSDGSGTGVLISESGFILTNHHVIERAMESDTFATGRPMIGLTIEPAEGSRVRMLGEVVAYDRDLDMALLRAVSDLYGSPLPAGYRFPAANTGDPRSLSLGDDLYVLGYPDAGSLGTRVSINLTRGIVSGFERRGQTLLIKTDADIAAGNSGGPVLNSNYEVIGIATEAISEETGNSQIGYIWPLWLVPADWWSLAGAGGVGQNQR